jgi:hypothetical protein
MFFEVTFESHLLVGANNDDLGLKFLELCVILAQLRHVPAAERSHKTAIENEQNTLFPSERRKLEPISSVSQLINLWRRCVDGYPLRHILTYLIMIASQNAFESSYSLSSLIGFISTIISLDEFQRFS